MNQKGCCGSLRFHSRRDFLTKFSLGFGGLVATDLLLREGHALGAAVANPLTARSPHFLPKAKSVVFLFMQGGPSQLETFDYKPLMKKYDGQLLPESFRKVDLAQTNTADGKVLAPCFPFRKCGESGLDICSIFPELSKHADKLVIVRSCHHDLFIHGSALTMMGSGTQLLGHPTVGAWVVYGLGCESDNLPAYFAMTDESFRNGAAAYTAGFLPAVYQGTHVRVEGAAIQNLERPADLTEPQQRMMLDKIALWNERHRDLRPGDSRLDARIANYELAFRMQSAAPELIDLSHESKASLDMYGVNDKATAKFGKMCLLARRMVERGVRYVHLVNSDWDGHFDIKGNHEQQAAKVDRPIAGLLTDLQQRGLLDSTLIVCAGEFGRTPIAQGNNGRDHHPYGFSIWMAGGGIRGGQVIGQTDDFGFHAVDDKVHVNDLHATMLSLLGLDHESLTYLFEGRERRLTDVGGYNDLSPRIAS